jgi:hypothetical protein
MIDVVGTGQPTSFAFEYTNGATFMPDATHPLTVRIYQDTGAVTPLAFVNPSFETAPAAAYTTSGSVQIPGWTLNNYGGEIGVNALSNIRSDLTGDVGPTPDGQQVAYIEGSGTISQTINAPVADTYNLGFWMAHSEGTGSLIQGGENLGVAVNGTVTNYLVSQYFSTKFNHFSIPVTLQQGANQIQFGGTAEYDGNESAAWQLPRAVFMDAVSITPTPVILNPGFETVGFNGTILQWTVTQPTGSTAGITAPSNAPEGDRVGFIGNGASISQTLTNWQPGRYFISYNASGDGSSPLNILLDGNPVDSFPPDAGFADIHSAVFTVPANGSNTHLLTFHAPRRADSVG